MTLKRLLLLPWLQRNWAGNGGGDSQVNRPGKLKNQTWNVHSTKVFIKIILFNFIIILFIIINKKYEIKSIFYLHDIAMIIFIRFALTTHYASLCIIYIMSLDLVCIMVIWTRWLFLKYGTFYFAGIWVVRFKHTDRVLSFTSTGERSFALACNESDLYVYMLSIRFYHLGPYLDLF